MTAPIPDFDRLRLLAGNLALDYVNTVENAAGEEPEEFLTSYPALARWSRHAGLIGPEAERALLGLAAREEAAAAETLRQALALRAAVHAIFLAIAQGQEPAEAELATLQAAYARAVAGAALAPGDSGFDWHWLPAEPRLEQPLWPVAHAAIALLTSGELARVKVCANPDGCGWLFYDGSKNKGRRWCSMEGCGSQVKMRRYYAKQRAT